MTRWQKEWSRLSRKSKSRLLRYSGRGSVSARRWRMFVPRVAADKAKFWNRLDTLIYKSAVRNNRHIKVGSSFAAECRTDNIKDAWIKLPKDPIKWATKKYIWAERTLKNVAGVYRRNTLEHELAEFRVGIGRHRRSSLGKVFRRYNVLECGLIAHNSVHPLIAEMNASGRTETSVRLVVKEWHRSTAQKEIFAVLRQFGWTPVYGLPVYGRRSDKIQKVAEKIFGSHYQKLIDRKVRHLERKYRGSALRRRKDRLLSRLEGVAGGSGLRRKYLR